MTGPGPNATRELAGTAADAVRQAEQLIRAEFALAKAELLREVRLAAVGVAALMAGFMLFEVALIVWAGALVLWLGTAGWVAALIGLGLAILAGGSTYLGIALFRRRHLERTQERLHRDARSLRESTHG